MADADIGWMHAEAKKLMLEAATSYPVYIVEVDAPDDELEFPHLVLWPPPPYRPRIALNGYGGEGKTTTRITAVGRDAREAMTALDRAAAALHRKRPDIPGRRCSPITMTEGAADPPPPQRDQERSTPDRPIYFTSAQFSLFSTAAPQEP